MNSKFYSFILIAFTIIGVQTTSLAQSPNWLWAKGVNAVQYQYGNSIATDVAGNSYITGSFQGTVDFDPGVGMDYHSSNGAEDIYLLKLDPSGNFLWAKTFGGSNTDEGISTTLDPYGNIYITGHFSGLVDFDPGADTTELQSAGTYDVFIVKLDFAGNLAKAWQLGGTALDDPMNIISDMTGNVYTIGYFSGVSDFNPDPGVTFNLTSAGSQDIFITKLDSSGSFLWAVNMGGGSGDRGHSLAVDLAGNVYSTGYFAVTGDFDPGAGVATLTSNGAGPDIFISKLDAAGNFMWAKSIGGTTSDRGNAITVDGAGNIYATGDFGGTVDFDPDTTATYNMTSTGTKAVYVLKLNTAGVFSWAKSLTTTGSNSALGNSIVVDYMTGDVCVAGSYVASLNCDPTISNFTLAALGIDEVFISLFDAAGNFQWAKSAGGTNSDYSGSISMNPSGYIYIAGTFHSPTISFGSITVSNAVSTGFPDIYIAKLDNIITGINEKSLADGISLYPNPAADRLYLSIPLNGVRLKITDMKGTVVYESADLSQGIVEIQTEDFADGLYLASFVSEKWLGTRKFMVIR